MSSTGCGGTQPSVGSTGGTSSTSPSGATSSGATGGGSSSYVPTPEPELTVPGGPAGKTERLSGVIEAGTESGCRLLSLSNGHSVQVIGDDPRLRVGARVTLEGKRVAGLATTCQEGTPFVVGAVIEPATPS